MASVVLPIALAALLCAMVVGVLQALAASRVNLELERVDAERERVEAELQRAHEEIAKHARWLTQYVGPYRG